jgi:hypothetical protein
MSFMKTLLVVVLAVVIAEKIVNPLVPTIIKPSA